MKHELRNLKPKPRAFFGFFILSIALIFMLGTILHLSTSWNAFETNSILLWSNLPIFSLVFSTGATVGTRRLQLQITDAEEIEKVKNMSLEFLLNSKLRIQENTSNGTTLESTTRFYRLMYNWFGTELVSLRHIDNRLIIEGPFRHVDSINLKLRFSKTFN